MAAGANPNGIGSGWVKALWITKKPVGEMAAKYDPAEYLNLAALIHDPMKQVQIEVLPD